MNSSKSTYLAVFLFYYFILIFLTNAKINVNELRCLVCTKSLNELQKTIQKIDPSRTVDVGGYRLDIEGNYQRKTVSQAKSEIHLSELIDQTCGIMDDYARATWKENGTLTLLKLIDDDGKMNINSGQVDFVQDEDLNKSLKYYCEEIMEEYEDNIIQSFQNDEEDINRKVCVETTGLCKNFQKSTKSEL